MSVVYLLSEIAQKRGRWREARKFYRVYKEGTTASKDIYLTRVLAINYLCNHFSQSFPSRQGKHMTASFGDYKRVEARDTYAAI